MPVFLHKAFCPFLSLEFWKSVVEFGDKFFFEGCSVLNGFQVLELVGDVASDLVKVDGVRVVHANKCRFSVLTKASVELRAF